MLRSRVSRVLNILLASFIAFPLTVTTVICEAVTLEPPAKEAAATPDTMRIAKIDIAGASRRGDPVNVQRAMGKQDAFYTLELKNRNPRRRSIVASLYLFDQATGYTIKNAAGDDLCNPCTYVLDKEHRSYRISLDDLVRGKEGRFAKEMDVFGALLVEGDVDFLVAKVIIRNTSGSPFRLSVFSFSRQELDRAVLE